MAERALSIAEGAVLHMQTQAEKKMRQAAGKPIPGGIPAIPDALSLLRKIHVYRAFDMTEQLATIKHLPAFLREHPAVHLVIIDSVAYHFRRGFPDMAVRARMLTGLAQELLQLASEFHLAVVVTNQVSEWTQRRSNEKQEAGRRALTVRSRSSLLLLLALSCECR